MHRFLITTVALIAVVATGCKERQVAPEAAPHAKAVQDEHAAQGFRPGSHEDWCGEHQVPESMCSRCNPSLIPAFKATGDWCVEHGLPESQCLLCNPGLKIVRPPKLEGK